MEGLIYLPGSHSGRLFWSMLRASFVVLMGLGVVYRRSSRAAGRVGDRVSEDTAMEDLLI